jgi:thiol-disulfide isomerase/thioredoxin
MSKTNDDFKNHIKKIDELELQFRKICTMDRQKAINIIADMRVLHTKCLYCHCDSISKSAGKQQNELIQISVNESALHVAHCIIRRSEKKIFGDKLSDVDTDIGTDSKTIQKNSRPYTVRSQVFNSMSGSEPSKCNAVIRRNPETGVNEISIHGLSPSLSTSMGNSDSFFVAETSKPTSTYKSANTNSKNIFDIASSLNNTSDRLGNMGSTEANKLLSTSNTFRRFRQGGGADKFDVNKATLINFWADWCPASIAFLNDWNKFKEDAVNKYPDLQVIDLNVQRDENKVNIAKSANVNAYPTLVLFCNDEVNHSAGGRSPSAVSKFVDEKM